MVDDVTDISKLAKSEVQKPLILFGHSMGSFISRRAIQKEGKIYHGLIISGTGFDPGLLRKVGVVLSSTLSKMMGKQAKSKLLDKLTFGKFNSSFKPAKTDFDWLSRDYEQVKKYVDDPHCGFICSTSFFKEMLSGIGVVHLEDEVRKTPSNLPIYIFSGDKDPVGNMGKDVKKVHQLYQNSGIKNVTLKLYPKGRHEMLHEINREEVFQDIGDWIDNLQLDLNNVIVS
jgi:alpha-beta hydrolase superfamily lysophospholipase